MVIERSEGGGGEAGGERVFAARQGETRELATSGEEAAAVAFGKYNTVEEGDGGVD